MKKFCLMAISFYSVQVMGMESSFNEGSPPVEVKVMCHTSQDVGGYRHVWFSSKASQSETELLNFASTLDKEGKLKAAKDIYESLRSTAISSSIRNSATLNLGHLYHKKERDFDKALSCYKELENVYEYQAIILNNLGNLYEDWNDLDQAGNYYKCAADLGFPLGKYGLGVIRREQNRIDEAGELFQEALEQGLEKAGAELGVIRYLQGRSVEAEALFNRAMVRGNKKAFNNLGNIYREKKDLEMAKSFYLRVAEEVPEAMYNLGLVFCDQQKYNEAQQWFEKASRHDFPRAKMLLDDLKEGVVDLETLLD